MWGAPRCPVPGVGAPCKLSISPLWPAEGFNYGFAAGWSAGRARRPGDRILSDFRAAAKLTAVQ